MTILRNYSCVFLIFACVCKILCTTALSPSLLLSTEIGRNSILQTDRNLRSTYIQYQFTVSETSFGNCIGHYLESFTCAEESGIDFQSNFVLHGNASSCLIRTAKSFPSQVNNRKNQSHKYVDALKRVINNCVCKKYCWETTDSIWVKRLTSVKKILSTAFITNYKCQLPDIATFIRKSAVIHFRCSDILTLKGRKYGFNNFHIYSSLIPSDIQSIIILAESQNRTSEGATCGLILQSLIGFAKLNFPLANITVKSGGLTIKVESYNK